MHTTSAKASAKRFSDTMATLHQLTSLLTDPTATSTTTSTATSTAVKPATSPVASPTALGVAANYKISELLQRQIPPDRLYYKRRQENLETPTMFQ